MAASSTTMHDEYLSKLSTLDLTHVQYGMNDPWGAHWALITLSPVLILAVYIAAFLHRRETIFLNVLFGQIVCEVVNGHLKAHVQQPRPTSVLGSGYGMPSSHSQFSGFFCAFWCLHILLHWPQRDANLVRSLRVRRTEQTISLLLVILCTALTCYSRHHLLYHTPAQIQVGVSIGLVFGCLYYVLTEYVPEHSPLLRRVRIAFFRSCPCRMLRLRDNSLAWPRDSSEVIYTQWMQAVSKQTKTPARSSAVDASHPAHIRMLLLALSEADHCDSVPTAFSVGCVIAVNGYLLSRTSSSPLEPIEPLVLTTGYSRELPGNTHAEECAIEKLLRYCARTPGLKNLAEARQREPIDLMLYTTMEPCSERLSGNMPCAKRILEFNESPPITSASWLAKVAQDTFGAVARTVLDTELRPLRISVVVQGVREPDDFVKCEASRLLRTTGVAVHSATPTGSPAALGLTCPNLASVSIRVHPAHPCDWLEDVCLRMARKGNAPT